MHIKQWFVLVLSTLILSACAQVSERNCTDFKTGTFEFERLVGTQVETMRFVRNDSFEIGYFRGKVDTSSVRWINDCEYVLQNINPKNKEEEKAVHIRILNTEANSYTFEFGFVGKTKKEKGTAMKVN